MKKALITGTAGFIGFHLVLKLIQETELFIVGIDSINDYYDVELKLSRLEITGISKNKLVYNEPVQSNYYPNYIFYKLQLEDKENLTALFNKYEFDYVIHLGAQAGVSYSITNPEAYINSNIIGFFNLIENCRHKNIKHLIYASTSSVYGINSALPLSEKKSANHPLTLYSATKKSNEMIAHSYSYLFNLPTTGLRFFTVYGTWGRPDMALFIFTKSILNNQPITVYNNGNMKRDFTYVDDITNSISKLIELPPTKNENWDSSDPDPSTSSAPYRILNIGNSKPINILNYIEILEQKIGKEAIKDFKPMRLGDIQQTQADFESLEKLINYKPHIPVEVGVGKFVDWYREYYKV